ncbi:MAG: Protein of unknown function precursor, partial [Bacteroidetes bacterium]|nr:Protein of unknown function precursor [Bacteroidota bacterium]
MSKQLLPKVGLLKTCLLLLTFLALFYQSGNAQVAAYYKFSQTSGTYTPIVGTDLLGTGFDDNTSTVVTIPSFNYNGTVVNRMFVCSNGWVGFRGATGSITSTNSAPLSAGTTATGMLAPMGVDLIPAATGSPSVSWAVVGTEVVVQWQDVGRYTLDPNTEKFNFQLRLDTASGVIRFVYDGVTGFSSGGNPQIGLRGTNNTFGTNINNRELTTVSPWTSTTAGTSNGSTVAFLDSTSSIAMPTAGLIFQFTPATCFPPTGVTISNITTSSADISWTPPTQGGTPLAYGWEVVAHGAGPTSTPIASGLVLAPTTTTNTGSVLSAATTYDVYLATGCSLTDTSAYSALVTFTTACNPVTTLPWTEGFEGLTTVGTDILPVCWSFTDVTSSNYSCSGSCNSNSAHTGTNFIGGTWSFNVWDYTPSFQLTGGTSYDYSFWYKTNDATNGYVVSAAAGTSATVAGMTNILGTVTDAISVGAYTKLIYTFTAPTTGLYYFGLHDSCPTSAPNGIAFDDFRVELTPACPAPTGLNSHGITATTDSISWTAPASAPSNGYNWEVVASGAGSGGTPVVSGSVGAGVTTAAITGLSSNTTYDVYVQANCGSGTSTWDGPVSITTPPTCFPPTGVNATNVTTTSADLNWTAPVQGTPAGYQWEVVASGAGPYATPVATNFFVGTGTTASTGSVLTPATTYDVYVKTGCSLTDTSTWSAVGTFTTLCIPISTLPWTEDFEGLATTGAGVFPTCWSTVNLAGTNIPGSDNGSISTAYAGPHSGTNFVYSKWNNSAWVFTPGFQLTAGTSYDFSYFMENVDLTSPVDFLVDVAYGTSASAAGMTNSLATGLVPTNTTYQNSSYTFTPATTGVYYFGVKSTSATTTPWYLSFDDFHLQLTPACVAPTALVANTVTATGATVSWTASTSLPSNGYIWEAVASGAGSGGTQVANGTTGAGVTTATISGLSANTAYDIYVKSDCGSGQSAWAGPLSITTPCVAITTIPWTEGFEGITTAGANILPTCWSYTNITNTNYSCIGGC